MSRAQVTRQMNTSTCSHSLSSATGRFHGCIAVAIFVRRGGASGRCRRSCGSAGCGRCWRSRRRGRRRSWPRSCDPRVRQDLRDVVADVGGREQVFQEVDGLGAHVAQILKVLEQLHEHAVENVAKTRVRARGHLVWGSASQHNVEDDAGRVHVRGARIELANTSVHRNETQHHETQNLPVHLRILRAPCTCKEQAHE